MILSKEIFTIPLRVEGAEVRFEMWAAQAGWYCDIVATLPIESFHYPCSDAPSRQACLERAVQIVLNRLERILISAPGDAAAKTRIGQVMTDVAAFRDQLASCEVANEQTTNREEEPVGQVLTGSSSLSPSTQESSMSTAVASPQTKTKSRRDRRADRRHEKNGHAGDGFTLQDDERPEAVRPGQVISISVSACHRHPRNRVPTAADVEERQASLQERGQLEPLLVRAIGDTWQILSGETRWLAARALGWQQIDARVVECDDSEALRLLAECNAHRKDLNPIEKARMIAALCEPKEQGGGGLSREEAGKIYGFQTDAGASNLVRLLKLPEVWQERVSAGEIPETFARALVPFAIAPRLMAAIEADYKQAHGKKANHWEREGWASADAVRETVDKIVEENIRPVEKGVAKRYDWGQVEYASGDYPILFELTDKLREQLDIVELQVDGKKHVVATNVAAYDKQQIPAIKAKYSEKQKKTAAKGTKENDAAKPLTAAQRKRKAQEQTQQLESKIRTWRRNWLLALVAARLADSPTDYLAVVNRLLLWLAAGELGGYDLPDEILEAVEQVGRKAGHRAHLDFFAMLSELDGEQLRDASIAAARALLITPDRNPKQPRLKDAFVDRLAGMCHFSIYDAWLTVQERHGATLIHADRLEEFFLLHTTEQLRALAAELKVHLPDGGTKTVLIKVLLHMAGSRNFPLPAALKPLEGVTTGQKAKAKR